MRVLLATLAFAGALVSCAPPLQAQPDERLFFVQGGTHPNDVLDARKCPPPFSRARCKRERVKKSPRPANPPSIRSDFRASIAALIDVIATAERVPARMAHALVRIESGGNPHLRGREGEWGLTQIKCQTARGLGFSGGCAALADPAVNLRWGLRHARRALDRGSIGFHQAGLGARRTSARYVDRIHSAMR
jgi:hypothetical protein